MTTATLQSAYPRLSWDFLDRTRLMAGRLGISAWHALAVMDFETGGTFSPQIKNPYSGFVGLIQFGPDAATEVCTTLYALEQMTAVEQLEYVERYFRMRQRIGALRHLEDVYMAVLYPLAIGRPQSYVLFSMPSVAYEQNAHLDLDGDGAVTKAEASTPVRMRLRGGSTDGPVPGGVHGPQLATLFGIAGAGLLAGYAFLTLYNDDPS